MPRVGLGYDPGIGGIVGVINEYDGTGKYDRMVAVPPKTLTNDPYTHAGETTYRISMGLHTVITVSEGMLVCEPYTEKSDES